MMAPSPTTFSATSRTPPSPSALTIFVPHCSDLLTDHRPHGDGLIAHGFITSLAHRGHRLHVAAQRVDLRQPLHPNISLYEIPLRKSGRMFSRLEYMFAVRRLFHHLQKQRNFDLIHQLNPVFTGLSLALLGSGLPLVLGTYVARWPNDPDSIASQKSWLRRPIAFARDLLSDLQQRHADTLVLTTRAARNRLPRATALEARIRTLPHGVDTELFSPAAGWDSPERLAEEQKTPAILFFANVLQRKGVFVLLEAFSAIAREIPNCILRIAGDGPALNEVKNRAASMACVGQIEFLGRQERSQAPALYRNSSVYCLPSYGEPYATTVLEAMSCARPVVVTDAGGLPFMIHERGGKKVPVGDPDSLAGALLEILRDPQSRVAMGRSNRALVNSTMTWDRVACQLEEIYGQTIQKFSTVRGRRRPSQQVLLPARTSPSSIEERV